MKLHLLTLLTLINSIVFSQITSSEIKGNVLDINNNIIPGAHITVLHAPTGRKQQAITNNQGHFFIPQLKPGGPYSISIQFIGFAEHKTNNFYLKLGETMVFDAVLEEEVTKLNGVDIIVNSNDLFSTKRKGTETNIGAQEIAKLPTINRSLQDMTRNSPQASGNSYVGSNYRYNNLSIDGVANNDAFGFQEPGVGAGGSTAAGSPGALAGTQPISLDAVAEIQVATSPYDVKLGNFTGGSLNVVTKSGTNKLGGTVYRFLRNNATTGRAPFEKREKIESFYNSQTGVSIGGAIKTNKLFYFFIIIYIGLIIIGGAVFGG